MNASGEWSVLSGLNERNFGHFILLDQFRRVERERFPLTMDLGDSIEGNTSPEKLPGSVNLDRMPTGRGEALYDQLKPTARHLRSPSDEGERVPNLLERLRRVTANLDRRTRRVVMMSRHVDPAEADHVIEKVGGKIESTVNNRQTRSIRLGAAPGLAPDHLRSQGKPRTNSGHD